jgi:hypothetical protein
VADYDYESSVPSSQETVVISEEAEDYDYDEETNVPLLSLLSMPEMGTPRPCCGHHAPHKSPALSLFNLLMRSKLNSFSDYDYDLGVGGSTPLSLLNLLFMLPHVAPRPPPPVGLLTITVHSAPVPVRPVNIGSGREYYADNSPVPPRPPMPPFLMPRPPMRPVPVQTLLVLPRQEPVQTFLVLPEQEPETPPPAESEPLTPPPAESSVPPSPPSETEMTNQIPVDKPPDGPIEEPTTTTQVEAAPNAIPPAPPAVEIATQDDSSVNSEIAVVPETGRAPRSIKTRLPDIVSYRSAP